MKLSNEFDKYTICLEIPSYMDFELMDTVQGALKQAEHPERVHFAICYQDDNMDMLARLKTIPNCRIKSMRPEDARGTGYARNQCQQLLDDTDDFFLQIDAHMRFVKNWDTILLMQWHSLNDEKAIISSWIPDYNDVTVAVDDTKFDKPPILNGFMCIREFLQNGSCVGTSYYCIGIDDGQVSEEQSMVARKHPLIVANYVFASA